MNNDDPAERPRLSTARVTAVLAWCPFALLVMGDESAYPAPRPLIVFAAASLKEVVTEVGNGWSRASGQPVRLTFDATSTLARHIQEGAPADVFISGAPEWLDAVKPTSRFDWLSNRLVCVVAEDIGSFDLRTADSLVLANEQVPAGRYARIALEALGTRLPPRIIYGANVRDVLAKVVAGAATGGIVYATDAAVEPAVRVAFVFPTGSHPPIVYSAGLLTTEGAAWFEALQTPRALAIARRHGFLLPP